MSSIAKKPKMIDYSDSEEEEGQILDQPEVIPEPIKYLPADQDILRRKIHKSLPTNQKPKSCHFCSNTPKYKCPKCQISTCSLKCCKQHKVDFSCDGVRDIAGAEHNSCNSCNSCSKLAPTPATPASF